ncbi:hypothetical protein LJR084_007856 [Variovorax sp. LjRoot84]
MWTRGDVAEGLDYQLGLVQRADGNRTYVLRESGQWDGIEDLMFVTAVVPRELLVRRDLLGIAKAVKLVDGSSFGVEAHGVWLTQEECAAFERNVPWKKMPWLNGLAPVLPSR